MLVRHFLIFIVLISPSGVKPQLRNYVPGESFMKSDTGRVTAISENEKTPAVQKSYGYEFGGVGLGFSLFYEGRLRGTPNGIGIRGGLGFAEYDISYLTIPLQVNYLLGNEHYFFEVGTGVTYLRNNVAQEKGYFQIEAIKIPNKNVNNFFWTISAGFRVEFEDNRTNGFWIFRIGITPFYAYNQWSAMIYFSLGGGN
jgi:hypothetical protein